MFVVRHNDIHTALLAAALKQLHFTLTHSDQYTAEARALINDARWLGGVQSVSLLESRGTSFSLSAWLTYASNGTFGQSMSSATVSPCDLNTMRLCVTSMLALRKCEVMQVN